MTRILFQNCYSCLKGGGTLLIITPKTKVKDLHATNDEPVVEDESAAPQESAVREDGKLKTQRHLKPTRVVTAAKDYPFSNIRKITLQKDSFVFDKDFVQSKDQRKKIYFHLAKK